MQQRPGFVPGSGYVGFSGGQSGTGTGFSPSSSISPCQYYSTVTMNNRPQFRDIVSPHLCEQRKSNITTCKRYPS
jgi:hypothetical protein